MATLVLPHRRLADSVDGLVFAAVKAAQLACQLDRKCPQCLQPWALNRAAAAGCYVSAAVAVKPRKAGSQSTITRKSNMAHR